MRIPIPVRLLCGGCTLSHTNQFGLFTLEIGVGTPVTGIFADIDWSANTYFLKVEADETGGSTYVVISTTQFLSVPYALQAGSAEDISLTGHNATELDDVSNAGSGQSPLRAGRCGRARGSLACGQSSWGPLH